MKTPENYDGPAIQVELKDTKLDPSQLSTFVDSLLGANLPGKNVSIYQKNEDLDGPLSETLMARLKAHNYNLQEMKDFMNHVNKSKIPAEIQNIRTASSFVEWSCTRMIKEVEKRLESDVKARHSQISNAIEKLLDNVDKLGDWMKNHGVSDA
jgi:nucleosome binding factor SPN SPT16 subunit